MSFTETAFIQKNTPELKEKLKMLGLEIIIDIDSRGLLAQRGSVASLWMWYESILANIEEEGAINCGTNEDLFLTIAAFRDDSDYMQWFIVTTPDGIEWVKSHEAKFNGNGYSVWEKATVKEIIEHFK